MADLRAVSNPKPDKNKGAHEQSKKSSGSSFMSMAKNPMVGMAVQALPKKVKVIIVMAIIMMLVGFGTTVYWIGGFISNLIF